MKSSSCQKYTCKHLGVKEVREEKRMEFNHNTFKKKPKNNISSFRSKNAKINKYKDFKHG